MKLLMLFLFITILEITSIEIASNYLLVDLENQELNGVGRSAPQARELSKLFGIVYTQCQQWHILH